MAKLSATLQSLITLALLLMPCVLLAQSYRGSIRGHVVDPSGNVMAGAKVTARNNATGISRETLTRIDGGYVLAELPAGRYVVMAQATNLNPVAQNVTVSVGLDTTADFDLTQVERRQEQITVTEETPLIDSTRDVLGEVVSQQLVADLPLNGRRDCGTFGRGCDPKRLWAVLDQWQPRPLEQLRPGWHRQQRSFLQQFRLQPDRNRRGAGFGAAD
jgi:hypothetical protein